MAIQKWKKTLKQEQVGWVDRCHVGCVLKIINRSPVWENFNKPGYYQLH